MADDDNNQNNGSEGTSGEEENGGSGGAGAFRMIDLPIEDELKDSYLTYAMSVIVSRALPDVRDGLKPSQRRILVAMNDLNLGPNSSRVKCAKISGDTSGNYHPHGESVIYPTLVRMAQEWNMRHMLVDKQGNFGSIAGLPPAAMRYTEARLSSISSMMLDDLKLDTVDQKRCQWDLVFAYVVQERVLQILFVRSHFIVALSGLAELVAPPYCSWMCATIVCNCEKVHPRAHDFASTFRGIRAF